MSDQDLALPAGAVLVHIGPYKTGSTAIQTSLHLHREAMREHGVHYPGPRHRLFEPGWALLERPAAGVDRVPMARWDELVAEVHGQADQRVCLSSEDLASARDRHIEKLVADLGPDRVHVVMVARRLDKLLPSSWQERVKSWLESRTYDEWLQAVLGPDPHGPAAGTFWHNQGIEGQVERWTRVLPPERVTVIVADESVRDRLPRTFEALLGLPGGLLQPGPHDNTSFSYDRIELLRRVNEVAKREDWPKGLRRQLVSLGLKTGLRAAPASPHDVPLPDLPGWAGERVAELSEQRAAAVAALPVRVVGDPAALRYVPEAARGETGAGEPEVVAISTAVSAVEGIVARAVRVEAQRQQAPRVARPAGPRVAETSSRELLREVARRQARRLRRGGTSA